MSAVTDIFKVLAAVEQCYGAPERITAHEVVIRMVHQEGRPEPVPADLAEVIGYEEPEYPVLPPLVVGEQVGEFAGIPLYCGAEPGFTVSVRYPLVDSVEELSRRFLPVQGTDQGVKE